MQANLRHLFSLLLGPLILSAAPAEAGKVRDLCENLLNRARGGFVLNVHTVEDLVMDIEEYWEAEFERRGWDYEPVQLTVFEGNTLSGCGPLKGDSGPVYCNADRTMYLDLKFFSESAYYVGEPDRALLTYVLAHEFGHHVQTLRRALHHTGIFAALMEGSESVADLLPRMEFQADCLSGVFVMHQHKKGQLTREEVLEALHRASRMGDDIQEALMQARGLNMKARYPHGDSRQRGRWFTIGMVGGKAESCEPFEKPVFSEPNP